MEDTAITRLKTGIQEKQVLFVAQYFQSVKNAIYTLNWCIIIAALKGKKGLVLSTDTYFLIPYKIVEHGLRRVRDLGRCTPKIVSGLQLYGISIR